MNVFFLCFFERARDDDHDGTNHHGKGSTTRFFGRDRTARFSGYTLNAPPSVLARRGVCSTTTPNKRDAAPRANLPAKRYAENKVRGKLALITCREFGGYIFTRVEARDQIFQQKKTLNFSWHFFFRKYRLRLKFLKK